MKRILIITIALFGLASCIGRSSHKKASSAAGNTATADQITAEETADVWTHDDIDWNNRQVFYVVVGDPDDRYISKSMRMFVVDEKIVIEEIPHEPFVFAIKKFVREDESNMYAILNNRVMSGQYYGGLLSGEKLQWHEVRDSGERLMRLVKDESTLIWTITYDGSPARAKFINSYDVLPSGYYYQNQNTMFHDPDNESFLPTERPQLTGVFDLDETPVTLTVDSEAYLAMEHPFEGKWLETTMTDIGRVVYDYPSLYDDGETHNPFSIEVRGDEITEIFPSDPAYNMKIEQVMVYPDSGYYCFKSDNYYYSFRWVDRERHLCEWTLYYDHGRIRSQDHFVSSPHNQFPVMMYDWE